MIRFVFFVETFVMMLIALFFVTQVLVPVWRNTKFFPILRSKRQEALDALVTANEEQDVKKILEEAGSIVPPVANAPIKRGRRKVEDR